MVAKPARERPRRRLIRPPDYGSDTPPGSTGARRAPGPLRLRPPGLAPHGQRLDLPALPDLGRPPQRPWPWPGRPADTSGPSPVGQVHRDVPRPLKSDSGSNPVHPDTAAKRVFWRRAEAALAARLITYGAYSFLGTLYRLAKARGDGQSFILGERVIQEITQTCTKSQHTWRKQLEAAGLIRFDRRWANKRGWFWEAKTTLAFSGTETQNRISSAVKSTAEERKIGEESSAVKSTADSAVEITASLIGSVSHQNGTEENAGSSLRSGKRKKGEGSSLRSGERSAAPAPPKACWAVPITVNAPKREKTASNKGISRPPPGQCGPPQTKDGSTKDG